jgi:hypothetical protein
LPGSPQISIIRAMIGRIPINENNPPVINDRIG